MTKVINTWTVRAETQWYRGPHRNNSAKPWVFQA